MLGSSGSNCTMRRRFIPRQGSEWTARSLRTFGSPARVISTRIRFGKSRRLVATAEVVEDEGTVADVGTFATNIGVPALPAAPGWLASLNSPPGRAGLRALRHILPKFFPSRRQLKKNAA